MRFEWDPVKARINWRKHDVSFDEASTVFEDAGAMLRFDHDHMAGREFVMEINEPTLAERAAWRDAQAVDQNLTQL